MNDSYCLYYQIYYSHFYQKDVDSEFDMVTAVVGTKNRTKWNRKSQK